MRITGLDLSVNPGYYLYNNNRYFSKLDLYKAIWEAKDPFPNAQFWFHDDVFSQINWTIEPEQSLEEMYRLRAQQIRDKYDYLILLFSGGADSNNVLDTFLKNNIFLDEVRTDYPIKMLEKITPVFDTAHPYGIVFEYIFAALPKLKKLQEQNLKTKITIGDNTEFFKSAINDEKFLERNFESYITTIPYQAVRMVNQIEQVEKYVEQNKLKNVGVIYAADKPALKILHNNQLMFYFVDIGCAAPGVNYIPNSNLSRVLFYWSRDLPLIPIKQSHIVKHLIQSNRSIYDRANESYNNNLKETNLLKMLLYPTWDKKTYQKRIKHEDHEVLKFFGDTSALDNIDSYVMGMLNKTIPVWPGSKNKHLVRSRFYKVCDLVVPS